MKVLLKVVLFSALALPLQAEELLLQEARVQTKQLAMQLQQTLKKSMKSEGPRAAIQVCNTRAPVIAESLSQGEWTVGRTALKVRNPDNQPDSWQKEVMHGFVQQLNKGANPMTLEASKTEGDLFYYMKAIPTGGVCLACHGETLAAPITAKLDELYPQDKARGFKQGELRGAFILSKKLR